MVKVVFGQSFLYFSFYTLCTQETVSSNRRQQLQFGNDLNTQFFFPFINSFIIHSLSNKYKTAFFSYPNQREKIRIKLTHGIKYFNVFFFCEFVFFFQCKLIFPSRKLIPYILHSVVSTFESNCIHLRSSTTKLKGLPPPCNQ